MTYAPYVNGEHLWFFMAIWAVTQQEKTPVHNVFCQNQLLFALNVNYSSLRDSHLTWWYIPNDMAEQFGKPTVRVMLVLKSYKNIN